MQSENPKMKFSFPIITDEFPISILNAINDGILVADKEGVIQFTNPEYSKIIGAPATELLNKNIEDVRPGAILPSVIRTGKAMSGVYREVGDARYVVDMAPIYFDGEIVGGVSIVKNITEVKKLSKALESAEKSLKKLQGTVANLFQSKFQLHQLKGVSDKFNQMISLAERAALGDANILILGESGTGKELIAQGIHGASCRKNGPFIPVNCAAIPHVLLESELFGYVEGAFTGAKRGGKLGLFQIADKGTLFLDEIGDIHFDMQAKLLRILQEQKVRRIGELEEHQYDVRIIAATNQDLELMIKRARFREDLYYRLNVIQLRVPTLRERREDILDLGSHFASECLDGQMLPLSEEVKKVLLSYEWPGNIRELKNVIEFVCNMADPDETILPLHLPERLRKMKFQYSPSLHSQQPLMVQVRQFEHDLLTSLLAEKGTSLKSKKKICQDLGISLATLYRKLEG